MVQGKFVGNLPLIQVVVGWGREMQAPFVILDTGFTGDLQVTPKMARELGLEVHGVTKAQIANGQSMDVPVAPALTAIEDMTGEIQALISDSMPLVGISFLTKFGYRACVDCKNRTVVLERVI